LIHISLQLYPIILQNHQFEVLYYRIYTTIISTYAITPATLSDQLLLNSQPNRTQ